MFVPTLYYNAAAGTGAGAGAAADACLMGGINLFNKSQTRVPSTFHPIDRMYVRRTRDVH